LEELKNYGAEIKYSRIRDTYLYTNDFDPASVKELQFKP
jgi:hypothetical protein